MKEGKDKQVYFIDDFSPEEMKYKSIIAISVLEDYVLMVDVCNWVNELINTSNSKKDAFWDVENKINGIKTLFLMGHIVREDHQEILERIAYDIAMDTIDGDKNERALKIQVALRAKFREFKTVFYSKEYSDPKLKHRNDMAMSILEDYVLMIDVCNWVNKLINTSNARKDAFWSVENKINGIQTLFHIGGIERLDHQEILEDIAYTIAINTIGGNKSERALKIKDTFLEKLSSLREDL